MYFTLDIVNGSSNDVCATTYDPEQPVVRVSGIPSESVSVSAQGSLGKSSLASSVPSPSVSFAETIWAEASNIITIRIGFTKRYLFIPPIRGTIQ